ncbi:MAG: SDR family NAD(P)-dependent oxidoreductase [Gammaproteobacteria bacterium]|nr:SDR family NAD(P)-dependent oxidoreductase [Gammaproteobacteria bacterium]
MSREVCLVTGVGPGTGRALVERFAQTYDVAMLARNTERLNEIEQATVNTKAYTCDVSETEQLKATLQQVRTELGAPSIVIHNAVGGAFGDFLSIDPDVLNRNFQINTMALLHLAQAAAPQMIEQGHGAILCTGNTSAYRGVENFAGFAPTKAAQRILCESMARHLGPKGVHVAFIAIDAVIDVPWTRKRFADKPDDFFCHPRDIADECYHVAHQARSAWTFNVLIRPFGENWSIA